MKKLFILALPILAIACSDHTSVEDRFKAYMKDTMTKSFDDPSSYQFVSIHIDTFRGKDYIENTRAFYKRGDTILHTAQNIEDKLAEVDSLSKIPGYGDSIWNYQAELQFRGKNKMGALILDKINLVYSPATDRVAARDK